MPASRLLPRNSTGSALPQVMTIARLIQDEFSGSSASLSGIGGVETGRDAAEFLLLGASTVQVGTLVSTGIAAGADEARILY